LLRLRNLNGGVPISEHNALFEKLDAVNWDDLNIFRAVAASSSFRQAAVKLSVSVNTVRTRVERLEIALGTTLLNRSFDGIKLSEDGQAVLNVTLEMQSSSSQLRRGAGNNLLVRPGELRICCAESLGNFWLTPLLGELNERLPDYAIMLHNEYNQNTIHSREFDLCIGYLRPENPESIVTKIATVHQLPFAAKSYISKFGTPRSIHEASEHQVILFDAPGINFDASKLFLGEELLNKIVKNRYNTGYSFFWAVCNGNGIAVLPTYVRCLSDMIVPIDVPIQFKFDIWLSFHHSSKNSKPIREAISWLHDCFDPVNYPWFSEKFVHPDDFESLSAVARLKMRPLVI
jgi:DNA-binding transcriptional LysR family regulator